MYAKPCVLCVSFFLSFFFFICLLTIPFSTTPIFKAVSITISISSISFPGHVSAPRQPGVSRLFQERARQVLVHAVFAPDVLHDLDLLDGAVRAQGARVGLLARVGQHVALQVAAFGEHPLAPGAHALGLGRAPAREGRGRGCGGGGGGGALEGGAPPAAPSAPAEVRQEGV